MFSVGRSVLMLAAWAVVGLCLVPACRAEEDGKAIFTRSKCNMCHTIESQQIAQLAVEEDDEADKPKDLSDVGSRRDAKWVKGWLTKEIEVDGKTHRKRFGGTPAELDVLAQWLASLKKK